MIKKLSLSLAAIAILAGCGSSSSGGAGTSGVNSTALTSFDAVTTLPDGTTISTLDSAKYIAPGQITTTSLVIKGGSSTNYTLSAIVYKMQNGALTPSSDINVTFSPSNITTGIAIQTDSVTIDATKAIAGNYQISVIATPVTKTSISGTPAGYSISTIAVSAQNTNMTKASYVDITALGSRNLETLKSGYQASNMIMFAFADTSSSSINQDYLTYMQTVINIESAGTKNFLSLGGANAKPTTFNTGTASQIVSNIVAQIKAYNAQLKNGKINGVDLDLENEIDSATITALAQGFHNAGLLVSVAPQVINTTAADVSTTNPINLALSSGAQYTYGAARNQYGPAITAGYVDTILAQTYNSGGFTVGGFAEKQTQFFQTIAQALNNTVKPSCAGVTTLCIPTGVDIVIGEPSNGSASYSVDNIFGAFGSMPYNQSAILTQLSGYITSMQGNSSYSNIKGVMQWSLNNDYYPSAWGDTSATPGAFSSTIFGSPPPAALPAFRIQITNTGNGGAVPYASASFNVGGTYYIGGAKLGDGQRPLASGENVVWGTKTSAQANPDVLDSSYLDNYFALGAPSFTTSSITINGYPAQTSNINTPNENDRWNCPLGANYTFQAGKSYNVMINTQYHSCDIGEIK